MNISRGTEHASPFHLDPRSTRLDDLLQTLATVLGKDINRKLPEYEGS